MYTLVIKKYKAVWLYLIVTAFVIIVDKVYAIFGHGVSSSYMSWMFLYPLLGGVLFYFLLVRLAPQIIHYPGYRLFYNLHNSGIVLLTVGSFMKGIFAIAGTDSPYVKWYYVVGFLCISTGIIVIAANHYKNKQTKQ